MYHLYSEGLKVLTTRRIPTNAQNQAWIHQSLLVHLAAIRSLYFFLFWRLFHNKEPPSFINLLITSSESQFSQSKRYRPPHPV